MQHLSLFRMHLVVQSLAAPVLSSCDAASWAPTIACGAVESCQAALNLLY